MERQKDKTIRCGLNNIVVRLNQKHQDLLLLASGVKLYTDTRLDPGENVTITGQVLSIPYGISDRPDYRGYTIDHIKVGDTLVFRYDVVFAYASQPDMDTPVYKNMMMWEGKEYWKCDIQKAFCVIRGERVIMLNGYVMVEHAEKKAQIFLPEYMTALAQPEEFKVAHIGWDSKEVVAGDTIFVPPNVTQRYRMPNPQKGKPDIQFGIIRQSHILGVLQQ